MSPDKGVVNKMNVGRFNCFSGLWTLIAMPVRIMPVLIVRRELTLFAKIFAVLLPLSALKGLLQYGAKL